MNRTFSRKISSQGMFKRSIILDSSDLSLSHFHCVGEFHDHFGHPQKRELYKECFVKEPKLVPFRISLMDEELGECKDARDQKDVIELADGLCDLSYVTNGSGHALGIDLDKLLLELSINIKTPKDLSADVDIDMFDTRAELIDNGLRNIEDNLNRFRESAAKEDLQSMGICLAYILDSVYRLGHSLNFNMDAMFREVHRSNMTKLCSNIDDAKESIRQYEIEGRYKEPALRIKGSYYVVYDRETSKILKNYKWELPNLKQFMGKRFNDKN